MIQGKFEQRYPSVQNAVDIFANKWATNLATLLPVENTGQADLLSDVRISLAAAALGRNGRLQGMSVLELGPLEGAHSYQIEQFGASRVLAIEANTEAFLKCLVLKEALKLRTEFMCGDVLSYLRNTTDTFDLIFCSGILYHMADPVELIRLICTHSKGCFVWTHYQAEATIEADQRRPTQSSTAGFDTTVYEFDYGNMGYDQFWGGNKPVASWMTRDEIVRAFAHFGMSESRILLDQSAHSHGAAFGVAFATPERGLAPTA